MDIKKFDENIALYEDTGRQVTYAELRLRGDLLYKAVNRRCLVFILSSNSIGSVLGYSTFLKNRVVPVLLSDGIDICLLNNLTELYHPSFLWVPLEKAEYFQNFESVYSDFGYSLLRTDYDEEYELYKELAMLLTTSGSTGSPKFVRQSYTNIKANTESIIEYLELNSSERPVTTLPMNYTYGLSVINTHLSVGATILLTNKTLMQKEFWEFVKVQKATSLGGVPYTYEILDKLRFYRMDLPSLCTLTQAGGKLTPELHKKFAEYAVEQGKKFVVMYGQCEATARMGYLPADMAAEKKGSMGIAIPGGRFKLVDVNGSEITSAYTTGELVYEGDNVTLGYAEHGADLAKGDDRNGILQTGDMARFDEDGYFYIVGRKKRFLKIYGNRVNLDEMDMLIRGKYEVEVTCAGVDDHMYIFLTDEDAQDDVRKYVSKTTKLNPAAFKTVVISEIPKNESGKIKYSELEKYYDV